MLNGAIKLKYGPVRSPSIAAIRAWTPSGDVARSFTTTQFRGEEIFGIDWRDMPGPTERAVCWRFCPIVDLSTHMTSRRQNEESALFWFDLAQRITAVIGFCQQAHLPENAAAVVRVRSLTTPAPASGQRSGANWA
jgi:hypothetical protein